MGMTGWTIAACASREIRNRGEKENPIHAFDLSMNAANQCIDLAIWVCVLEQHTIQNWKESSKQKQHVSWNATTTVIRMRLQYIVQWARRWRFKECNSIAFQLRNASNCMQLHEVLVCTFHQWTLFSCYLIAKMVLKLIHKLAKLNLILLCWIFIVLLLVKMHVYGKMFPKTRIFEYVDAFRMIGKERGQNYIHVKLQINSARHLYDEADSARVWSFMAFAYVK